MDNQVAMRRHQMYVDASQVILEQLPEDARRFAEDYRPVVLLYGRAHAYRDREAIYLEFVSAFKKVIDDISKGAMNATSNH